MALCCKGRATARACERHMATRLSMGHASNTRGTLAFLAFLLAIETISPEEATQGPPWSK